MPSIIEKLNQTHYQMENMRTALLSYYNDKTKEISNLQKQERGTTVYIDTEIHKIVKAPKDNYLAIYWSVEEQLFKINTPLNSIGVKKEDFELFSEVFKIFTEDK
jgi:hypothetical protein